MKAGVIAAAVIGASGAASAQHALDKTYFNLVWRMLPRQLLSAEGTGVPSPQPGGPLSLKLQRVSASMRVAEQALAEHDVYGRATAAQQAAVEGLDALLAELESQCERLSTGAAEQRAARSSSLRQSPNGGAAPAESFATTPSVAEAQGVDRGALDALVRDLWGHLPARQRDELLQPLAEQFLPQYAAEIEAYFEALAERRRAEADVENAP
ncbi:MAG: hypothetical protein DCC67_15525 [Planctomycetota bacterium]|nr:MAG: hypothetical protein DCC67_15525 [Planctomycetota bacterium]